MPARVLCEDCWLSLVPAEDGFRLGGDPPIPAISPFLTGPALLEVIRFLKFRGGRSAAQPLSWWLAFSLRRHLEAEGGTGAPDPVLVPVPLFHSRLAERGYNQAELLARRTAGLLGLEYCPRALRRTRNTRPQSKLGGPQRTVNVRGAFEAEPAAVEGRRVVVVDDLLTTGETMLACVAALLPCRPLAIEVLTVGRGSDR
ncbi:MAG: ComF family protein [Candidatus Krumholzibacteria bacterium]|nr:ComF family protein [Candidatus Krumholzibacteria bacterium]